MLCLVLSLHAEVNHIITFQSTLELQIMVFGSSSKDAGTTMYSYIIPHCNLTSMWSLVAWEAYLGDPIQIAQLYLTIKRQLVILIAE
jgi:hypothetical protein